MELEFAIDFLFVNGAPGQFVVALVSHHAVLLHVLTDLVGQLIHRNRLHRQLHNLTWSKTTQEIRVLLKHLVDHIK